MITYFLSPAIPSMSKASIPDPTTAAGDIDKVQTPEVRIEHWLMFLGLFAPLSMYYWTCLTGESQWDQAKPTQDEEVDSTYWDLEGDHSDSRFSSLSLIVRASSLRLS